MTENEAIDDLMQYDNCAGLMVKIKHETCVIAIQAIEEIQQYRAIGTVEEFKALKEKAYLYEQAFYLLLKDDCKRLPEGWTGSIDELYVGRKQFYLDKVEKTRVLGKIKT